MFAKAFLRQCHSSSISRSSLDFLVLLPVFWMCLLCFLGWSAFRALIQLCRLFTTQGGEGGWNPTCTLLAKPCNLARCYICPKGTISFLICTGTPWATYLPSCSSLCSSCPFLSVSLSPPFPPFPPELICSHHLHRWCPDVHLQAFIFNFVGCFTVPLD